jgi:excisionase family DNA binding protein
MSSTDLGQLAATLANLASALAEQQDDQPSEPKQQPKPTRVLLTVEEAAEYLGVGRTLMYRLIKENEVTTVQIGRLRRVPREAIDNYAARILAEQSAA